MTPMTRNQKVAAATALAAAIAAPAEGLRRVAYYDPPGILTVCMGHTGKDIIKGKTYSLDQCKAFFTEDMKTAIAAVDKCHPNLPVGVLAAMGDAAFNLGPRVACDSGYSSVARSLYSNDFDSACNNLLKFNKAKIMGVYVTLPGLASRRQLEKDVCMTWKDDNLTKS